jgi:3',5'-cyclic AMP phosphodiesterase CpdA
MDVERPRRRRWARVVLQVGALVVVVAVATGAIVYWRQLESYVTHRKGSPTHTTAYEPYEPLPDVHIGVAGDIGDSGSRLDRTAAAMAVLGRTDPYDVLLLLGDNVYPAGDPARLPATVFAPFKGVLSQGAKLLAIVGNHDVKQGHGEAQMRALGMPGLWWSRRVGDVEIVGIDSNIPDDKAQRDFLEHALATTDARWKIVALHHPPYSAGYQGSSMHVREVFAPIFAKYGVQLVLSGHDHDYQRSELIDGVTYVVSGAAAGTRRTGDDDFTAESFSWHHFVDIAVFRDRLVLRAVNQDRRVADEAVLRP